MRKDLLCALIVSATSLLSACGTDEASPTSTGSSVLDGGAGNDAPDTPDASCASDTALEPGVVMTDRGAVRGVQVGDSYAFKGIPYAAPPTGPLRWRPPEPAACWQGARDTSTFGSVCTQYSVDGPPIIGDEDCLTLNVWTPAAAGSAPLPVLFFVHGGSHVRGSSSQQILGVDVYDGQYLAEAGPAVVVTINYRLGAMGFLADVAFESENQLGVSGNYGLMDQIAALQWVQRNIAAFGGDPSRVMLFGQSAGAIDTCILVASKKAAGLFSRALMHSGNCTASSREHDNAIANTVAARLGCVSGDIAGCLRAKTAEQITAATTPAEVGGGGVYHPTIDGSVLTDEPLAVIGAGEHNRVPLIVGNTGNEMALFIRSYVPTPVSTDDEYRTAVLDFFGAGLGDSILQHYPSADYPSPEKALEALFADAAFVCPTRRVARVAQSAQKEPVRRFVFLRGFATGTLAQYGAAHGFDLFFALHHLGVPTIPATMDEMALADAMVQDWTRFAATGDPNGGGSVEWPLYDPASDSNLAFDVPITVGGPVRPTQCDFWDTLQP